MSKTVGMTVLAMALAVGITGGKYLAPSTHAMAATPSTACGAVDLSRFTPVSVDDAWSGKVTATRVVVQSPVVMNMHGDYTDLYITMKTSAWDGKTFAKSLNTESVQEFRPSLSPMPGTHILAYGYLRKDSYHGWYEVHPVVAYAETNAAGKIIAVSTPTCSAPATAAYVPQSVSQVATGQFPYPRAQVRGTVLSTTTYKGTPAFWFSDGISKMIVELNPEFASVHMPKVGQKVTVTGMVRQDATAGNRWEMNPVYSVQ